MHEGRRERHLTMAIGGGRFCGAVAHPNQRQDMKEASTPTPTRRCSHACALPTLKPPPLARNEVRRCKRAAARQ